MTGVIGAMFGLVAAVGVVVAVAGVRGFDTSTWPAMPSHGVRLDRVGLRAGLAAAGLAVGLVVCRWPVAALWLAVAGAAAPSLVGAAGGRRLQIARGEAVAGWAEMVRDTMAGGAQVEQALSVTAAVAPPLVRPAAEAMVARMHRQDLDAALVAFASEMADPAADLVVASLLLSTRTRAGDLAAVLGHAAAAARASASMRLRIDASRARTYTAARLILAITALYAVGLVLFDRSYLDPFDTAIGQVVLAVIGATVAAGVTGIAHLSREATPQRLIAPATETNQW